MLSDENYFLMQADDLEKDTMQLQIINDDHLSNSQFVPMDSIANASGFQIAMHDQNSIGPRSSIEKIRANPTLAQAG